MMIGHQRCKVILVILVVSFLYLSRLYRSAYAQSSSATVIIGRGGGWVTPPIPPGFTCAGGGEAILAPDATQKLLTGKGKTNVCYSPTAIIIHWSAQPSGHSNQMTYNALINRSLSCQYGTDDKSGASGTWQMLEMFETAIEKSSCTGTAEYNKHGINIEIAGSNFDNDSSLGSYNPPTPQQYERTLDLTCFFKAQYNLPTTQIFGHNELGVGKPDPGRNFLRKFRTDIDKRCP